MILWIIFILKFGACYGIPEGDLIDIENATFVAAILRDQKAIRTGSILSRNCILTSSFDNSGSLTVRAGSSFWDKGGHLEKVIKVIIHPKIGTTKGKFDFAIVVIEKNLPYTDKIQPVSIPSEDIKLSSTLYSFGFGPHPTNTNQLTFVYAEVHAYIEGCDYPEELKDHMICVFTKVHEDADFGASLARGMVLYGTASYSLRRRTIFTNVFLSRGWINDVIKENHQDDPTTTPTSSTTKNTSAETTTTDGSDDDRGISGSSSPEILTKLSFFSMFWIRLTYKYYI